MEKQETKIIPYFSSKTELPTSFKVNKRYGVYEKIQKYKIIVNSSEFKEEGLYNLYIREIFKKSYKIKYKYTRR